MDDHLKAALRRENDEYIPEQYQARVLQARYEGMNALEKMATQATAWVPRFTRPIEEAGPKVSGALEEGLEKAVTTAPVFATENSFNLLGEIMRRAGTVTRKAGEFAHDIAEVPQYPDIQGMTLDPDSVYGDLEFIRNYAANRAAIHSGNKHENWLQHTSDFLEWAGLELHKKADALSPLGYREGLRGLDAEGKPLAEGQQRPIPKHPVTGEPLIQPIYDVFTKGKVPERLDGLVDTVFAITPDVALSLAEYRLAGGLTQAAPLAYAVHMGMVDALNAWKNGTDAWAAFKSGVFAQQAVFPLLGVLPRPLRAGATAFYFGGKEAIKAGIEAGSPEAALNTFLHPDNLAHTLTMVWLTGKGKTGKPLPEIVKDVKASIDKMPETARARLNSAAEIWSELMKKDPANQQAEAFRRIREARPHSTLEEVRPQYNEDGTVKRPGYIAVKEPGFFIATVLKGNPEYGSPDLIVGGERAFSFITDSASGKVKWLARKGATSTIVPGFNLVEFLATRSNRINVYRIAEPEVLTDVNYTPSVVQHELGNKFSHIWWELAATRAERADAIRSYAGEMADPEAARALADKIERMPLDPRGRIPLTEQEVDMYRYAQERFVEDGEALYRGGEAGKSQAPSVLRRAFDAIGDWAKLLFPPSDFKLALEIQRLVSDAADQTYREYRREPPASATMPEAYMEGREAQKKIRVKGPYGGWKETIIETGRPEHDKEMELIARTKKAFEKGLIDYGPWDPNKAGWTLFVLPDGNIMYSKLNESGVRISHPLAAELLGYLGGEKEIVAAGAVRLGGSMYGVRKEGININTHYIPNEKQIPTLELISNYMNEVKHIYMDSIEGGVRAKISGNVAGFVRDLGDIRGGKDWTYYEDDSASRTAIREVQSSLYTKTERLAFDPRVIPPSGVDPDKLVKILLDKGQVKKEEVKWLRLNELAKLQKDIGEKVTPEKLREWILNQETKVFFNREGGVQAKQRIMKQVEDAHKELADALKASGVEDKDDRIVRAVKGGMMAPEQPTDYIPEDLGVTSNVTTERASMRGKYIDDAKVALGELGLKNLGELKELLGDKYASLEPSIQKLMTASGIRNSFVERLQGNASIRYPEYTTLKYNVSGSPAPNVDEFYTIEMMYDLPQGNYNREFFKLEDAQNFAREWYQQPFTFRENMEQISASVRRMTYEAEQPIEREGYPDRGNRIRIISTEDGTYQIDAESAHSTALIPTQPHTFSSGYAGSGMIGWARGGKIDMPDGKTAGMVAEVQGDVVQKIEDKGIRELPVPKITMEQIRQKEGHRIREGEIDTEGYNVPAISAVKEFGLKTRYTYNPPNDFIRPTGSRLSGPELEAERQARKITRGNPVSILTRIRTDLINAYNSLDDTYATIEYGSMQQTMRDVTIVRDFLTKVRDLDDSAMDALSKHTETSFMDFGMLVSRSTFGRRQWTGHPSFDLIEAGSAVSAFNRIKPLLERVTNLEFPDMFTSYQPLRRITPALTEEARPTPFDEDGLYMYKYAKDKFTLPSGTGKFIGLAPPGTDPSTLDPKKKDHWDRIFIGPDTATVENMLMSSGNRKSVEKWLAGHPDAPMAEMWREHLWLESLRYAAEAGYDYFVSRTAYHPFLEWGTQAIYWTPVRKVNPEYFRTYVDRSGGVRNEDGTLSLPSMSGYYPRADRSWDARRREMGNTEFVRLLREMAIQYEIINSRAHDPDTMGAADRSVYERLLERERLFGYSDTIEHIKRRITEVADEVEAGHSVSSAVARRKGSNATAVIFGELPSGDNKYTVYRKSAEEWHDPTFTAPEFNTPEEAEQWRTQWEAQHDTPSRNRRHWNEPWTDTTAEFHYEVNKSGDGYLIVRTDSEGTKEPISTHATAEEAQSVMDQLPRSGPITKWQVRNKSLRRHGPDEDPEVIAAKDPQFFRAEALGGQEVADFQSALKIGRDLHPDSTEEAPVDRWGHGLWKRMQAKPEGGAYFPRYEGWKINYENVGPNILRKRIKRFGLEPVMMNTVDISNNEKPVEATFDKTVETHRVGPKEFSQEAFAAELTRLGTSFTNRLGQAVQALGPDGVREMERMEQDFISGRNRSEFVNWIRARQQESGLAPDAFSGWDEVSEKVIPVYKLKFRMNQGDEWTTIKLQGVDNDQTAANIAQSFLLRGAFPSNVDHVAYYGIERTGPPEYLAEKFTLYGYGLKRTPEGGLEVTRNPIQEMNSFTYARDKANRYNEAKFRQNQGYRETFVIGFPITPDLRTDLLFNSRSRFKMQEVPAVTLKPATEEELAQFKDLIDPKASPELITEGKILGINLDKVRTTDDVKRAISATERIYSYYIDAERRGVRSHAVTKRAAAALGMTVDELLSRPEGMAYNAEQIHAAFNIAVASAKVLHEMANYVNANPSEENNQRFMQALGLHKDIQAKFGGARAEAGRSVEILKVGASGQGQYLSSIGEALTKMPGATPERLADMISKLPTVEQTSRFVRQMEKATTSDVLIEIWINGLLTGPKSHMANIIGNLGTTMLGPTERFMAGVAGKVGSSGGVYPGEAAAMGVGFFSGLYDAFRIMSHNPPTKYGELMQEARGVTKETTKMDYRKGAISAEQLQLTGPIGNFVDVLGRIIRSPGGALETMDQVFKLINYRMELNAQAYRTAINEGKTGSDVVPRVKEILEGRDQEVLDLLQARANEWANYQTFTNELGAAGQAAMRFSNSKWWAKMVLPFIRTPANIFKYGLDRMPVLNLLQGQLRSDIMAGGVRRDMALSKIGTSALALAVVMGLAQSGYISGAGPSDKNLRKEKEDAGWLPYAIKYGDTWHSYNRFEPFGAILGVPATMVEMWDDLPEGEMESYLLAATLAFSQAMVSKTYMKGLSDVLAAISDPGANTEKVARSYLGSLVPTVLNQADSAMFDQQIREVWTRTDALKDRIPGLSSTLPPKRDVFGHPRYYPNALGPDFVSPIATRQEKSYPAMKELVRVGVGIPSAPRWIFGDRPSGLYTAPITAEDMSSGVRLDHMQYDRMSVYRGQIAETEILNLMQDPRYRELSDGPEGGKADVIRRVFAKATEVARARLLQEDPALAMKVEQRLINRGAGKFKAPAPLIIDPARMGIGQ